MRNLFGVVLLFRTPGVDDSKGIFLSEKTFPERERGEVSMKRDDAK